MPNYKRKRVATAYRPRKKRVAKYQKTYDQGRITKLNPSRGVLGFPATLRTQLRYSDVRILTSTLGGVATYVMRMNSLFDPDFTSIGHQPYYFDQLSGIYDRYSVVKSKMVCKFSLIANTTATAQPSGPVVVGVKSDDDGTISGVITTAIESSGTKSDFLNNALGGNNVKTLSVDYEPNRDLGMEWSNDSLLSLCSANPSRPWFGTMFVSESGLASPTSVAVKVDLYFDVIFTQQLSVTGS